MLYLSRKFNFHSNFIFDVLFGYTALTELIYLIQKRSFIHYPIIDQNNCLIRIKKAIIYLI